MPYYEVELTGHADGWSTVEAESEDEAAEVALALAKSYSGPDDHLLYDWTVDSVREIVSADTEASSA